jgi:phage gp36-like protein
VVAYCAKDDVLQQSSELQLIQLTNESGKGWVDEAVLGRAIADADAEIDTYARQQYPVPLSPVPDAVRKASVAITLYNLHVRRGKELGPDNPRRLAYKDAVAWLKEVSKGQATLGTAAPAPNAADLPKATTDKGDRAFTVGRASDGSTGSLDDY